MIFTFRSSHSRRAGRPPKHDVENWTVADDWPERVPITDAELGVFEAWFGDLFDEMFGPRRRRGGAVRSQSQKEA
jgi:hypothetical protein